MALLFCDGFDHYSSAQTSLMWSGVNNTGVTSTNARNGGQCLQMNDTSHYVWFNMAAPSSTFVVGAAYRFNDIQDSNGSNMLIAINDANINYQLYLKLSALGQMLVYDGNNNLLGSSASNVITLGSYFYIEFKGTISSSISANTCMVNVNGANVINLPAGTNTKTTSNTTFNRINMSGNGQVTWMDDVYICDQTGSVNNDFLGDIGIVTLFPDANGDSSQWTNSSGNSTSNYTYVDETSPDSDSTYVKAGNINLTDLYDFSTLGTTANIFGVQQCVFARKDASGTRHMQTVQKVNGTVYDGNVLFNLSDNYRYYRQITEQNPDSSANWTTSDINGSQFGIESIT